MFIYVNIDRCLILFYLIYVRCLLFFIYFLYVKLLEGGFIFEYRVDYMWIICDSKVM